MKWRGRRTSDNVQDRRGSGGGFGGLGRSRMQLPGMGRGRMPRMGAGSARRGGGIGIGLIVILGVAWLLGVPIGPIVGALLGGGGNLAMAPSQAPAPSGPNTIDDPVEEFVSVVLADTEAVWTREFAERGGTYHKPTLVLFSGSVSSACGTASAAVGPFYCPGDQQVYLDTEFFHTLERKLGAGGDFPRAYVIAHEVGHHVQNLIGVMERTQSARMSSGKAEANRISVMTELQADCFAGIWARELDAQFGALEPGDIEEAMTAAAAIGDDALQRSSQGYVVPDSFTHGTSEQRQRWFGRGYESGDMEACDTFSTGGRL